MSSIGVAELTQARASANPPIVIDVRRRDALLGPADDFGCAQARP
jgi:hypothetical protein